MRHRRLVFRNRTWTRACSSIVLAIDVAPALTSDENGQMKKLTALAPLILLLTTTGCVEREANEPPTPSTVGPAPETSGYVLHPDDGEVLVPCRPGSSSEGRWVIKADPSNTGSSRLAMGTQDLPGGEQIPVHRHEGQDEVLFVHEGHATGIVGDSSLSVGPGTTIYVPQGVWHGVRNTQDDPVKIVWVVAPPGLEDFFRAIGMPPDEECVPIPAEDMAEIQRQHGITQRIE